MAVTGKSTKGGGKSNRFRPFNKRGSMPQPPMPFLPLPPWHARQPKSSDDRHVMAKHASLYPAELPAFQKMVIACEKALKLVSDKLSTNAVPPSTDSEIPKKEEKQSKEESKETDTKTNKAISNTSTKQNNNQDDVFRSLRGVQRVGVFGHGLLLQTDTCVELVALSAGKPTETLLNQIYECFPSQLSLVTEEKYELEINVAQAAIMVIRAKEPKITCKISLTSPIMRENMDTPVVPGSDEEQQEANSSNDDNCKTSEDGSNQNVEVVPVSGESGNKEENETETLSTHSDAHIEEADPPDVLNRAICLNALAELRRAKWFQARARGLPNCLVVLRILRDLSQRIPLWSNLHLWAMELLVEKCLGSVRAVLGPGNALRRVFECLAAGIILPSCQGLYDPCEREPCDPIMDMSAQDREDITAAAQHMLRLIAFRRIRKVLDMEPLPPPHRKFKQRKRKRVGEGMEGDAVEKRDKQSEDVDGDELDAVEESNAEPSET
ncbi:zinc finger RNA-binding protein-like [Argonauta hians]